MNNYGAFLRSLMLGIGFTREEQIAMLHVDIHRSGDGCCCTDPKRIVICPGCPQHSTATPQPQGANDG